MLPGIKALQILAESMRKFFPEHAVLGRNGGDESAFFCRTAPAKEAERKTGTVYKTKSVSLFMKVRNAHLNISLG